MTQKYEFVPGDEIHVYGSTLKRIRATVAIVALGVSPGDLGGYIEAEKNLDQNGNARVSDKAWVFGDAQVSGDAQVFGDARVFDKARGHQIRSWGFPRGS